MSDPSRTTLNQAYPGDTDHAAQALRDHASAHPHRLIFVTGNGSRLYGFNTPGSDYDLSGAHVLTLEQVISLDEGSQTTQSQARQPTVEITLVTHDVKKYFTLLLNRNGNVLEKVFSPLVVQTSPAHQELKKIAAKCITRGHAGHYHGMAKQAMNKMEKEDQARVKYALHVYRAYLTGIHLMKTGEVQPHLPSLNQGAGLSQVDELIRRRTNPADEGLMTGAEEARCHANYERLAGELKSAASGSKLPETPTGRRELNDLIIRLRLETG